MIALPTTYWAALLLAIFTMFCWGSWANTMKLTGPKWRFELFYYDYSLGVLLVMGVVALTFGSLMSDITVLDNLSIVRLRQPAFALVGGAVFNLANMLLVGAIAVAGLAVAFPIGIGLALVIGVIWNYVLRPQANPFLLFGGASVVVAAIILASLAYGILHRHQQHLAHVAAHHAGRKHPPRRSPAKGIILSLVSGVLMGSFYPLVQMGRQGDIELGPYALGLMFGIGVFVTTLFYNIFFTNLPVQGEPISMFAYFKGSLRNHLLGVLGGGVWAAGTVANFAAASAPAEVQVGPAVSYALGQGATLISTLWGLLYWKEFAGAPAKATRFIVLTLILYVVGLTLVSVAPLFA